jgi:hypothetical protein
MHTELEMDSISIPLLTETKSGGDYVWKSTMPSQHQQREKLLQQEEREEELHEQTRKRGILLVDD